MIDLSERGAEGLGEGFAIRVKAGEYEVELKGTRNEVLETVKELPDLMADFVKAFENLKPKPAALTVKAVTATVKKEYPVEKYPKIGEVKDCRDALLKILESDWGKWRPRTFSELKDALAANKISYSERTLTGELHGLVETGKVRRWKTDKGYVYILAEKEILAHKEESR